MGSTPAPVPSSTTKKRAHTDPMNGSSPLEGRSPSQRRSAASSHVDVVGSGLEAEDAPDAISEGSSYWMEYNANEEAPAPPWELARRSHEASQARTPPLRGMPSHDPK